MFVEDGWGIAARHLAGARTLAGKLDGQGYRAKLCVGCTALSCGHSAVGRACEHAFVLQIGQWFCRRRGVVSMQMENIYPLSFSVPTYQEARQRCRFPGRRRRCRQRLQAQPGRLRRAPSRQGHLVKACGLGRTGRADAQAGRVGVGEVADDRRAAGMTVIQAPTRSLTSWFLSCITADAPRLCFCFLRWSSESSAWRMVNSSSLISDSAECDDPLSLDPPSRADEKREGEGRGIELGGWLLGRGLRLGTYRWRPTRRCCARPR